MSSSGFFNAVDSAPRQDSFPGFPDEGWECFSDPNPTFAASPIALYASLPDPDPSFPWPLPPLPIHPSTRSDPHPSSLATLSPNANVHIPDDVYGLPLQPDIQSIRYQTSFFDSQDSRPTLTTRPSTHQPSATHQADRLSMHTGLQRCPCPVLNGTPPVHDTFHHCTNPFSPPKSTMQARYDNSSMFVDQTQAFNSTMGTAHQQSLPTDFDATPGSFSILSSLTPQPIIPCSPLEQIRLQNSRRDYFVTGSRYSPIRTYSLPTRAVSPEEIVLHTCQWMKDDGTICAGPITRENVAEHLIIHGVKKMAHDHLVPCRWFGCRLRGDKCWMNRESIVRHVRERHLGYRRSSKH